MGDLSVLESEVDAQVATVTFCFPPWSSSCWIGFGFGSDWFGLGCVGLGWLGLGWLGLHSVGLDIATHVHQVASPWQASTSRRRLGQMLTICPCPLSPFGAQFPLGVA